MKKWADLKCDGKRRIASLRGPNGCHLRKKKLGAVERMVHKILMMSPRGGKETAERVSGERRAGHHVCVWFQMATMTWTLEKMTISLCSIKKAL